MASEALHPAAKALLAAAAGAALGYAYAKLVGCRTGACPLTATPWRAMSYFAFLGLLFGWPR